MSSSLKQEFRASFRAYVDQDSDVRLRTLNQMMNIDPGRLIEITWVHDLAALMTCAVALNPDHQDSKRLRAAFNAWQRAREAAEEQGEDPAQVPFDEQVNGLPFQLDEEKVPGLRQFVDSAQNLPGGQAYLAQVFVCLIWAHCIPFMKPNLYNKPASPRSVE